MQSGSMQAAENPGPVMDSALLAFRLDAEFKAITVKADDATRSSLRWA
jgi:hypothetical protein